MSAKTNQSNRSKDLDTPKANFIRKFRDENSNLKKLTASQFVEIWGHYDKDKNGYIEGSELDTFLCELATSTNKNIEENFMTEAALRRLKETFLTAFDEDSNGKITIDEMAEILPVDENFLLLFHRAEPLKSSIEFVKIWRKFDKNCSGFIELDELKEFVEYTLSSKTDKGISEERIIEYTKAIMDVFDSNKDGKLQYSEMSRLMPVRENIMLRPIFKSMTSIDKDDLEKVFGYYDINNSQLIEGEEIDALVKDLIELVREDYDECDFNEFKKILMDGCDVNNDNKLRLSELKMVLKSLQGKE